MLSLDSLSLRKVRIVRIARIVRIIRIARMARIVRIARVARTVTIARTGTIASTGTIAHCLRLSLVTRVRIPWDSITRESGLRTQFRSSEYLRI